MTPVELSDHLEITRLLYLYARAIDRKSYEALRDVFTPDAVIHYNVERGTKLEFRELEGWLERALETFPVTLHVMSNPLIELLPPGQARRFPRTPSSQTKEAD
jgi:hypothetical protein